uniref:THAP-type domain-containing protein n=1 Tax=Macrostomum lignano TaxID=282301 RepID=A0A1I8IVA6_9PLAT
KFESALGSDKDSLERYLGPSLALGNRPRTRWSGAATESYETMDFWTIDYGPSASATAAYEGLRNNTAEAALMSAAADSASSPGAHGNSAQLLVLTGLLCVAVLIAVITAVAVTSSAWVKKDHQHIGQPISDELAPASAPATRRCSLDRSGARKSASSDRLDRVDLVSDCVDDVRRDQVKGQGEDAVEKVSVEGPVDLRFCTKLDLAEGIVYLRGFRLGFATLPGSSRLDSGRWRANIDIDDSCSGGCHRWSIEAGLRSRRRGRREAAAVAGAAWQTEAIDYVVSLRLGGGRLSAELPHKRRLRLSAWAAELSGGSRLRLGEFQLPLHLVNEPGMEFGAEFTPTTGDVRQCQQLRPPQFSSPQSTSLPSRTPRLHLGLLYSPGAHMSSISVRLVEVFDLDHSGPLPGHVTALVALSPGDQSQSPGACLTACPTGSQSAFIFDWSQPATVLAIDNVRMQAASVGVAICVAIGNGDCLRPAGRILLSDFALASSSSAMRHWTAAVARPNSWFCTRIGLPREFSRPGSDTGKIGPGCPGQDPVLRQQWLRAIPTADLKATSSQRVCSKHFTEADFVRESTDKTIRRKNRKFLEAKLQQVRLKSAAVPTQFDSVPKYLSKSAPMEWTTSALSSSRLQVENARLNEMIGEFLSSDELRTLSDLLDKLDSANIPSGFVRSTNAGSASFFLIDTSISGSAPHLTASLTVFEDLTYQAFVCGLRCTSSMLGHLFPKQQDTLHLQLLSTFENLLAFLKSLAQTGETRDPITSSDFVEEVLKSYLGSLSDESDVQGQVKFLLEQFSLIHTQGPSRRYTPTTTVLAYLIFSTSRAAYKAILDDGSICLPSIRNLVRLTSVLSKESGIVEEAYIQLRAGSLDPREKYVVLIIDEVTTAKRVEFNCDSIYGLSSDGKVASSILAFLVKSIGGSYQDVVGLFPVNCLTASHLSSLAGDVIEAVAKNGFEVVALSCDNSAVNRKFYSMSAANDDGLTMKHPCDKEKEIFLLMDTTHNIKNVYNNFQRRREFHCPTMDGQECFVAKFSDIEAVFEIERGQSSKIAYRLTEKVLRPLNVERTSASLAAAVFDETTVSALQLYSTMQSVNVDTSTFNSTAKFLSKVNRPSLVGKRRSDGLKGNDSCRKIAKRERRQFGPRTPHEGHQKTETGFEGPQQSGELGCNNRVSCFK